MTFKIDYVECEQAAGILHRELTQEPGQGYEYNSRHGRH